MSAVAWIVLGGVIAVVATFFWFAHAVYKAIEALVGISVLVAKVGPPKATSFPVAADRAHEEPGS